MAETIRDHEDHDLRTLENVTVERTVKVSWREAHTMTRVADGPAVTRPAVWMVDPSDNITSEWSDEATTLWCHDCREELTADEWQTT